MSAYEQALSEMKRVAALKEVLQNQIPEGNRDKTGLRWEAQLTSTVSDLVLRTSLYHGFYGQSSVSRDSHPDAGKEIAQTLTEMAPQIVAHTIARLEKGLAVKRAQARSEAKAVLDDPAVAP